MPESDRSTQHYIARLYRPVSDAEPAPSTLTGWYCSCLCLCLDFGELALLLDCSDDVLPQPPRGGGCAGRRWRWLRGRCLACLPSTSLSPCASAFWTGRRASSSSRRVRACPPETLAETWRGRLRISWRLLWLPSSCMRHRTRAPVRRLTFLNPHRTFSTPALAKVETRAGSSFASATQPGWYVSGGILKS